MPDPYRFAKGLRTLIRMLFTALLLILATLPFGSAGQVTPAHAAPAGVDVRFYMDVLNPRTTVCTGESVTYSVSVKRQYTSAPPGWTAKDLPEASSVVAVKVEASSTDKSVGTFKPPASGFTGMEFDASNSYEFEFVAGKKPGKTTLYFEGAVKGFDIHVGYVSFKVPVTVIVCAYRVDAASNWYMTQGTGGSITVIALLRKGVLFADEYGQYSGTAEVSWIPSIVLPPACSHSDVIASSQAQLQGGLDESGRLWVKVIYDPSVLHEVGECPAGPATQRIDTRNSLAPAPLSFILPAASGGTWRGTQALDVPALGAVPGFVFVIVVPQE